MRIDFKLQWPLVILLIPLLFSCSESDLISPEENEIYLFKKNSISKIELNKNESNEDFLSFNFNAKKAARNEKYLVVAGSSSYIVDEEIGIYDLENDEFSTIDITTELNYSDEMEGFELNDIMIFDNRLYVLGIKYNYNDEDLVELIEIDLNTQSITRNTEFSHENVAANKYFKLITEKNIYFNFINKLTPFDIEEFDKPDQFSIETSYYPGNIMIEKGMDLHYYDFQDQKQFTISSEDLSSSSEQSFFNINFQILARERPLAVLGNTVLGFYLENAPSTVGIYQYDYENQKILKTLQDEELNNTIFGEGYFMIESKFIRVIANKVIYYGIIFNEEKSSHEYILSILNADFNRIQSYSFDNLSGDVIAIL